MQFGERLRPPTLLSLLAVPDGDEAALPELVRDGENGFLAPPGDAEAFAASIRRLLDDPKGASVFGGASLAISRAHAEERTYDSYEALYREYATKPPRA